MSIPASKVPKRVKEGLGMEKMASKLELQYREYLTAKLGLCEINYFEYQPRIFELSDDCQYTPDFKVCFDSATARTRFVEVKGCHVDKRIKSRRVLRPYWRDSGDRVRYLWARQDYGDKYDFVIAMRDPKTGEWQHIDK